MAAKLVNVFPLLRGEQSVIEALEAVNNALIKDIQTAGFDYIERTLVVTTEQLITIELDMELLRLAQL